MNKNINVYTNNNRYQSAYRGVEDINKNKSKEIDLENENIKIIEELAIENENIEEELENIDDYNQIEGCTINSGYRHKEKNKKECIDIYKDKKCECENHLPKQYSGQIYKSRRIILSPPKKDVIVSITSINRYVDVNDIEVLENGINVKADITISLNYGTSKDIFIEKDKPKEDKKQEIVILEKEKKPIVLTDGVVRNATIVIPCNIYISIPENKIYRKYRLVNQCLKVSNTQYILDDGSIVCGGIPIGGSLKGIMENYIVSLEVEVI